MDTTSLKEYIFNNNKVEFVLEKIGCKSIKYHSSKIFTVQLITMAIILALLMSIIPSIFLSIIGLVRVSLMIYQILSLLPNIIRSVHL